MKAIVYDTYGSPDVLQVREIATPVPGDKDVLVRVHATSVNYGDLAGRNFAAVTPRAFNMPMLFWVMAKLYFGLGKPRNGILGSEFSGEVESVGKDVTAFRKGDRVFGYLGQKMGAYAELLSMPENGPIATMPTTMNFEQAAVAPYGAMMALHFLRKAQIRPGQKVLVNGASGGIGSAAVQIAKHFGAEVTGVCGAGRMDYVHALGADTVIDYKREDFTQRGEEYDLIVDIRGRLPYSQAKRELKKDGRILYVSFKTKHLLLMLRTALFGGPKVLCTLAPGSREDLLAVRDLIEQGQLKTVVAERFPMSGAADAHRLVEGGKKSGAVAITFA
ncbi:MAG: NAD(P)-dependent alcohol dehydrogenase [Bacteroidetes bacterium]|nr:NAD(P)-dependent alcohol dehydrogenase [Bacteroidota bacterium]